MRLKNKVAFITGGTSGIGLATAKLFQQEGAHLVIVGSDADRLQAAARDIGGEVLLVEADLRRIDALEHAVQQTHGKYGRIDIVFANAGAATFATLETVTPDYIQQNLALNFSLLALYLKEDTPY